MVECPVSHLAGPRTPSQGTLWSPRDLWRRRSARRTGRHGPGGASAGGKEAQVQVQIWEQVKVQVKVKGKGKVQVKVQVKV